MKNKIELLSVGDASLDVFMNPSESEAVCEIDDREELICFGYGDKIPVKTLEFSVGGNAANNAVGTRRLGVNSAAILTLGADDIGTQIINKLKQEGVDTTYVFQQKAVASNYSTVINYGGERTIFTYKAPRSYEWPLELPEVSWVYLTSMGDTFRPFTKHLLTWLEKYPNTKLAFNPGSRQLRAGILELEEIMKRADYIYVNRKEAEMLTGFTGSEQKEKALLKALSDLGPKTAIITDGVNGSFVYDGGRYIRAGVLPIDAYERTGAGDAFGSGCLAALVKGKGFDEALLWGTLNSASVIGYVGSQRGLLTAGKLPEWIARAESSNLKVGEF